MKKKSLAVNATLNSIKTICGKVFPLITFPYVTRVLHVNNLGIFNYCDSIISYFLLLAGLGISTYAIRNGAKYRENKEDFSEFASEVFTINLIATALSYILLFLLLVTSAKLKQYSIVLLILSIDIIFTTFGCEWVFNVYEDFGYITVRSIAFQILSMLLLFSFVHTEDDLIRYVIISVVAKSGANIINAFSLRKYCRLKIVISKKLIPHLGPILILFANTVTTTIYISSDMTMLGYLCGTYYSGLYSVSTKLYFVIKNVLSAIIVVSIPRLSAYCGANDLEKFKSTANSILEALIVMVTPAVVGLYSISRNVVLIIAGKEYVEATLSLKLLSVALLFCLFGWFYTSCILIPNKMEKKVLIATISAATANVVLNLFLIPVWNHNAAAFTTALAELISLAICHHYGKNFFKFQYNIRNIGSVILGNIFIYIICKLINIYVSSVALSTLLCISASIIAYLTVLIFMKNTAINYVMDTLLKSRRADRA